MTNLNIIWVAAFEIEIEKKIKCFFLYLFLNVSIEELYLDYLNALE
jgi:hypothetical protein